MTIVINKELVAQIQNDNDEAGFVGDRRAIARDYWYEITFQERAALMEEAKLALAPYELDTAVKLLAACIDKLVSLIKESEA